MDFLQGTGCSLKARLLSFSAKTMLPAKYNREGLAILNPTLPYKCEIALQQSQQGRRKTQACSDILTLHENQRNGTNEIKETRKTKESFLLGNFGKKLEKCLSTKYIPQQEKCQFISKAMAHRCIELCELLWIWIA